MSFFGLWKKKAKLEEWTLKGRRAIHRDGYQVEIHRGTRECVSAVYKEDGDLAVFDGEYVGRKWEQMNLLAPREMDEATIAKTARRVAEGLRAMGQEFVIYRLGQPIPIPEEEQAAAMEDLKQMGLKVVVAADKKTISVSRLDEARGVPLVGKGDAKEQAMRMNRNVHALQGVRRPVTVLAKSDGAQS